MFQPQKFSQEWVNDLLECVDITQVIIDAGVELKEHGSVREFVAFCPFHNETTPSFTIIPLKQMFHCFGCGMNGNVITFLMEYNYWSFARVVVYLAKMAGHPLSQSKKKRRRRHGRNSNWEPKRMPVITRGG